MFNGTSTQDRSICVNCGRVNPTQWANDGQRDTMHNSQCVTQCNTVHNKTLELQKCNNRLSNRMTYLLKYYVSAFTNTKSVGCSFASCPGHCMTVHTFAHSTMPWQKQSDYCHIFSRVLVLGNSMRIDKRQSIQLCSPHTGCQKWEPALVVDGSQQKTSNWLALQD